jgi:hypothetical protein
MKIAFYTFIFCLGILHCSQAQTAALHSNDPSVTVNAFLTSITEKNTSNLRSLVTTDFAVVSWNGDLVDSYLLSQGLQEGIVNLQESKPTGMRTKNYGDAAVITGNWKVMGEIEGNRVDNFMIFTALVVKQGGVFKLASFHLTPVQ